MTPASTPPLSALPRTWPISMTIPFLTAAFSVCSPVTDASDTAISREQLDVETVVAGLDTPWDLLWGPDDYLWVSERHGAISRVHPGTGEITPIGQLQVEETSESGLMGMALHPRFDTEPYLYAAHSYRTSDGIRNRLVRMRYDGSSLGTPVTLLADIPGNRNHDGSRLVVGPDDHLYMTTGDAGRAELAQNLESVAGKVLRLTLDGAPAPGNPFGTPVYSFGHRNPQGIVFHPQRGLLYVAEHGPSDNDEVNLVVAGGNYGWPSVHGFCDGDTPGEDLVCDSIEVVQPLAAWTPTVALSGLAYHDGRGIPGWKGSLLVTSLAGATLFRLQLTDDGSRVTGQEEFFRGEYGRLRDVLVGPAGEVYLATSNRDGRGRPREGDDRILRVTLTAR